MIVNTLDDYEDMIPFLQDPDRITTNVVTPEIWKTAMKKDGQYNDHIFVQLTSNWLKRDIIILPWNKDDDPLDFFIPTHVTTPESKGLFHLLYYPETLAGTFGSHYQSILPLHNAMNESEILDVDAMSNESNLEWESGKRNLNKDDKMDSSEDNDDNSNDPFKFIYPKGVIEEFTKRAEKYKDEDGSPMQLLAYLVGYNLGDLLIGTELIFPNQFGFFRVYDNGIRNWKLDIKYNSRTWILTNSATAKKHGRKVSILARLRSNVIQEESGKLSSNDVHIHNSLEKRFGHVQSILVEIDQKDLTKTCSFVYRLTEMGRKQIEKCPKSNLDVHEGCDRPEFYQEDAWVEGRKHVKVLDFKNDVIDMDVFGRLSKEYYDNFDSDQECEEALLSDSDTLEIVSDQDVVSRDDKKPTVSNVLENANTCIVTKCIACIVRKYIACSCIARRKIAEGRGPQMAESAYRDRIMSDNLGVQHRLRTMHTACLPACLDEDVRC